MKKTQKIECFENFKLTKHGMNQISGSRSKFFMNNQDGNCSKIIDQGESTKVKVKERYEGKC